MSLLLNSLKKADQENAQAAAEGVAPQAADAGAPPPAAGAEASGAAGGVDFDSIIDDTAAGGAPEQFAETKEKELVSASRVFRAGGDAEASGGGVKRFFYVLLGVVVLGGGGFFVIESGVIPGVSFSSLRDMVVGAPAQEPVAQTEDSGPVLEAVSDDSALLLPQPIVDIQSEIATFSDFTDSEALETPEGRRDLAQRIALLADVGDEDIVEDVPAINEQDIIAEQSIIAPEGAEADAEVQEIAIKTAEVSRNRKKGLDAKTPVDNILRAGVKNNSEVIVVAQASEGGANAATETPAAEQAPAAAAETDSSAAAEEVKVAPSLSGADRQRMLGEANQLYISGSFAEAEAAYRNVLAKNSTNVDALRGLALVAVATGRYQLAVATYLKILEYYPNDPVAIADLANLHGVSGENFYVIEEALKKVLGKRPEWDGRLYFALGNLYASNQRWSDAQKAYFDAYASEQENPDYAYNLAVMLDYLNKPLLAVNYYRQALDLAEHMPSGFDSAQVESRINIISK